MGLFKRLFGPRKVRIKEGMNVDSYKEGSAQYIIGFKSANGVLHGLFRAEKNGVCFVEAVFKNGELHGRARQKNTLTDTWRVSEEYENGRLVSHKLFWTGFTTAGELAKHFEFNPEQDIQGMMSAYISDYFESGKFRFILEYQCDTSRGTGMIEVEPTEAKWTDDLGKDAKISKLLVSDGDIVQENQILMEVSTDKAVFEFECFTSGVITLKVEEGDRVEPGDVLCLIEKQKK